MKKDVILRKLNVISSELQKLQKLSKIPMPDFVDDYRNEYVAERLLEKIIGAAIDINIHILVSKGEAVPDTYASSFFAIGKLGIIPIAFAEKIAASVGMRNKIIHDYEDIEEETVYETLPEAISQYAEYVKCIFDFLKSVNGV